MTTAEIIQNEMHFPWHAKYESNKNIPSDLWSPVKYLTVQQNAKTQTNKTVKWDLFFAFKFSCNYILFINSSEIKFLNTDDIYNTKK